MRFGVIGAGVIGRLRAQTIIQHSKCQLVGVVDPDADAATRATKGSSAVAFETIEQLLDSQALDAVIVSSPLPAHDDAVLASLARETHVLCEKPLSNTVDGCRRMVDAAQTSGRTLATGFNHRFYPAIKFVKQVLDAGDIGAINHARAFAAHDGLHNFKADWQFRAPESGGGAMMDVGIHVTDLVRYLVGEIAEVYGVASEKVWQVPGSEDNAIAVFKTTTGIPVSYQATWTEWRGYKFYLDVYGDRGMVRGYYAPMSNLLVTRGQNGQLRKTRRVYPSIMVREKLRSWESTALASFEDELEQFLCMIDGSPANCADGVAGLRAIEIARAVQESTESGQVVTMPVGQGVA